MLADFINISETQFAQVFQDVTGITISPFKAGVCMRISDIKSPIVDDPIKLAWVAGIIEGEGCIQVAQKRLKDGSEYPTFSIRVNMTDEDVVRKLADYVGLGVMRGPIKQSDIGHKPFWSWTLCQHDHVMLVLNLIHPHMGLRRSLKIDEALAALELRPQKRWQHGTRNGYEQVGCRCKDCVRSNTRRHAERRRRLKARAEAAASNQVS